MQTGPENTKKNASENGRPQIITQSTMASPKANYQPQEAQVGTLDPPYPQEKKTKGGTPLTTRE